MRRNTIIDVVGILLNVLVSDEIEIEEEIPQTGLGAVTETENERLVEEWLSVKSCHRLS